MKGLSLGISQMSEDEKSDIIKQHKHIYNGYRTMLPKTSNTQPLYVYDDIHDKDGITVNNKGEVKKYTNMGINEQFRPNVDLGKSFEKFKKNKEEKIKTPIEKDFDEDDDFIPFKGLDSDNSKEDIDEMCNECGGMMTEGECNECGYTSEGIYDVEDLNPKNKFDYVEGELDEISVKDLEKGKKYSYKTPAFDDTLEFDDETSYPSGGKQYSFKGDKGHKHSFGDKHIEDFLRDLDEQGGNTDDMDVDDVEPAYDFESGGPGMGNSYPVNEYDEMESAFNDDDDVLLDETGITGDQGIYTDMDPAYDFDSEGPGNAGPYQIRKEDDEWEEIDEDLQETFFKQKNRINEMMDRMKKFK